MDTTILRSEPHSPTSNCLCHGEDRVVVAAAESLTYERKAMARAVRQMLDGLEPPLHRLVHRGDRVIVKVNMGRSGARRPEERYTSHPLYVEALLEALLDCGGHVAFGD